MIDGILAAFKAYTPEDLDGKSLPELSKLYVRAMSVIRNHPTAVTLWTDPNADNNDPSMASEFER